jgi:hypothetical protein
MTSTPCFLPWMNTLAFPHDGQQGSVSTMATVSASAPEVIV